MASVVGASLLQRFVVGGARGRGCARRAGRGRGAGGGARNGAGGGTRYASLPLTAELPKPLVPLGDRPFVAHLVQRLARAGFHDIVMNVHHHADQFFRFIDEIPGKVHLIREVKIRGTAGGIAGARRLFDDAPIVVWNGDILVHPPFEELVDAARDGGLASRSQAEAVSERERLGIDARGGASRAISA